MPNWLRAVLIFAAFFGLYPALLFGPMFTVALGGLFCVWLAGGK